MEQYTRNDVTEHYQGFDPTRPCVGVRQRVQPEPPMLLDPMVEPQPVLHQPASPPALDQPRSPHPWDPPQDFVRLVARPESPQPASPRSPNPWDHPLDVQLPPAVQLSPAQLERITWMITPDQFARLATLDQEEQHAILLALAQEDDDDP